MLLYAMLFGQMPFKAASLKDLATVIQKGSYTFPTDDASEGTYFEERSTIIDAKDLIRGLIRLKPEERLNIPQILAHKWMRRTTEDEINEDDVWDPVEGEDEGQYQADVNVLKIKNLYTNRDRKLSYEDYCYIANDFYTQHIDEEALRTLEGFGYPKDIVIRCLHKGTLNHAIASYNLLTL